MSRTGEGAGGVPWGRPHKMAAARPWSRVVGGLEPGGRWMLLLSSCSVVRDAASSPRCCSPVGVRGTRSGARRRLFSPLCLSSGASRCAAPLSGSPPDRESGWGAKAVGRARGSFAWAPSPSRTLRGDAEGGPGGGGLRPGLAAALCAWGDSSF